jgi:hypothetical protein
VAPTSGIGAIYAETKQPPFAELFAESPDGLQRFVLLDADGLPEALRGNFPFAGQTYSFAEDVTGQVDSKGLTRVGCSDAFAVEAAPEVSQPPFARLYVTVADRLLAFDPVKSS